MNALLSRSGRVAAALLLAVGTMVVVVDHADARRAGSFGSFGSRGARTFQAPAPTQIAPNTGAPIQRTMTPRPAQQPGAAAQPGGAAAAQRPGLFGGGFMGPLLGGLALGGLFGMLMGNGFGGAAGFLGMILQIALIGIVIMLVMRFFRSRQQGASAAAAGPAPAQSVRPDLSGVDVAPARAGRGAVPSAGGLGGMAGGLFGGATQSAPAPAVPGWGGDTQTAARPMSERLGDGRWTGDEIGVTAEDLDEFERILTEVQAAYTREDFGKLRALTTPEAMGYLAEELGETATKGQRNEVSDIRLLDGDVAEAWSEDGRDYVTAALRYESRDVLRDRATNAVVEGGDDPSEATELWTFVRDRGAGWKLAAIQAAA
jgi:predicted lipid-binding transport protein (Tim44 family)